MTCNNSKLDLVNMKAYIEFGEILSICSQNIEENNILSKIKGHNSCTNEQKIMCNNPKLDLVNIYSYIKFCEILSISSQDIEWKQN